MSIKRWEESYNNRSYWTVIQPGKSGSSIADTAEEAQTKAAETRGAIVMPPQAEDEADFSRACAGAPPVSTTVPPPPAAVTGQPVAVGQIAIKTEPIQGGVRITVDGRHHKTGDEMRYLLEVRLNGTFVPVKQLLAGEVVNPNSYTSSRTFDVLYADIDKVFADTGHPNLKVTPGVTEFGVLASFSKGHQAGLNLMGDNDGSVFMAPKPPA